MPPPKKKGKSISDLLAENNAIVVSANSLYAELNHRWQTIEETIAASGVLRPVFIETYTDEPESHMLGLRKLQGKWRLCYGVWDMRGDPDDVSWTPVVDSPLFVRTGYFEHLADLIANLIESNKKAINDISLVVRGTSGILETVLPDESLEELL